MKKQLQKNLYAFIVTAMMFSVSVNAQIVYTDVNPDVVRSCSFTGGCGGAYSIDLNNDGINDFILAPTASTFSCSCNGGPHGGTNVFGQRDEATISSTSISWIADTVGGYALNTRIDSSLDWINANHSLALKQMVCVPCSFGGSSLSQPPSTGPWNNVSGKYVALKIKVGTNFYYGWIKLGVAIAGYSVSITIMEYAYNSIPNQPILAGETNATGIIENSFASSISLFPNPATNHLTIALGNNCKKAEVTIADITGKIIYSIPIAIGTSETQNIDVNTEDFSEGIYVVQIQASDFIATKKLVVKK
jgi:hypothetical protein